MSYIDMFAFWFIKMLDVAFVIVILMAFLGFAYCSYWVTAWKQTYTDRKNANK